MTQLTASPTTVRLTDPFEVAFVDDQATLNEYSTDPSRVIRAKVASNSNCSANLLRTLSTDEDAWVRREVADNRSTPPEVLVALAADTDPGVRLDLARSFHAPVQLLCLLWCDPNETVRENIRSRVSQEQFDAWKQQKVAELADLPDEMFLAIYRTLPQATA